MPKKPIHTLLVALLGLTALLPLTGCVPVVATGAAVGVMMAEDRRASGTYLIDEENELKAGHRLRESGVQAVHANFTSYNKRLLITGEAPTAELKAKVEQIARGIDDVREVYNEMAIAAPSGIGSRTNDGYISAKVKTRLWDDDRISGNHVKVVTENSVVYLMGLLKRDEAAIAAEIAAKTAGVVKVVKVIEYLD
jgi:osmotically-inducible protein OsmY